MSANLELTQARPPCQLRQTWDTTRHQSPAGTPHPCPMWRHCAPGSLLTSRQPRSALRPASGRASSASVLTTPVVALRASCAAARVARSERPLRLRGLAATQFSVERAAEPVVSVGSHHSGRGSALPDASPCPPSLPRAAPSPARTKRARGTGVLRTRPRTPRRTPVRSRHVSSCKTNIEQNPEYTEQNPEYAEQARFGAPYPSPAVRSHAARVTEDYSPTPQLRGR